tara:strand:+ start:717 stop:1655 length:939 start_codon:yes stop_codon:yes gene_type:complete
LSERKKINILTKVLGDYYQSGAEMLFHCPRCEHHKKKFSVNVVKNVFKCWVCEYSGRDVYRLIRRYGGYNLKIEWRKITNRVDIESFSEKMFSRPEKIIASKLELPEQFISLANKSLPPTAAYAMNYLASRGVNKHDVIRWKIGYCSEGEYASRVVVPSFDLDGDINYFVGRSYSDDWMKYKTPQASKDIVFNELYIDFDEDIVLVEGVFDAIVAGQNSIPVLGSTLRERSMLFQQIVKNDSSVYLAFDADAQKKEMLIIEKLLKYDIEVYKISVDPYSDVGEMKKDEFIRRKNDADFVSAHDFLARKIANI